MPARKLRSTATTSLPRTPWNCSRPALTNCNASSTTDMSKISSANIPRSSSSSAATTFAKYWSFDKRPAVSNPPVCPYSLHAFSRPRDRVFAQEPRRPVRDVLRLDELRVQPFDNCRIPQALGIVAQIMWDHRQNMKAFLQLEAERRVVLDTFHDLGHVFFGLQPGGAFVIAA